MKLFSALLVILSVNSSFGVEANPSLYKKYYKGNFIFDGNKITSSDPAVNFSNEKHSAFRKDDTNQYNMSWDIEKNGDSDMLTISESSIVSGKDASKSMVTARTSSFFKNNLRASTVCYGQKSNSGSVSPESTKLKCVTATRRACDRLMKSYFSEADKNKMISKAPGTGLKETLKNGENCKQFLASYSNMAKEFANQSDQVAGRQSEVIDQDLARLKTHVNAANGNKVLSYTSLNSTVKASDLDSMTEEFAGSIDGIQALNSAIETCAEAHADFEKSDINRSPLGQKVDRIQTTK